MDVATSRYPRKSLLSLWQSQASQLVQASFLMLFVELMLMRWVGANVYYLFAFANFVLMASFLGIGLGFLRAKTATNYFRFVPFLLLLVVYLCYRFSYEYHPVVNPATDNLDYSVTYFKQNLYPLWLTLPVIFLLVTSLMAALADRVARLFILFAPLPAYRLEVVGSLLGVSVFGAMSWLHAAPIWWGVVITSLYISLTITQLQLMSPALRIFQFIALVIIIGIFGRDSFASMVYWSPYYKIHVQEYSEQRYVVAVNGLAQQIIESVAQRVKVKPFYVLPYQHWQKPTLNEVLIIGAGTGGDVAIALSKGAQHIDAVEIDPVLYQLGKQFNPNQPYADPRVHVIINDGRAFLQQTTKQYDLIVFALTDSLFLIPGQSSLRLENYLYTTESMQQVRQHLTPSGIFTIYNYYGPRWVVDRLANTITTVFQQTPCLDTFTVKDYWATVMTISNDTSALQCPAHWQTQLPQYATPSTDDHPFLYLMNNKLPLPYAITIVSIFLVSLALVFFRIGRSVTALWQYLDLFCMGAAFLLLETKSVITFALLFGTTWFVNVLVFVGILLTVLLAIEVTARQVPQRMLLWYSALFVGLFLAWCVPTHSLLALPAMLRFVVATGLVFLPVFIANVIFAERFRQSAVTTEAFGVNLLGAVCGGLLEYGALIVGYNALLLVVAFLYLAAILLLQRRQLTV